jgi:hypothetical protein
MPKFKPNSKPIKANFGPKIRVANPKQTQTNPIKPKIEGTNVIDLVP